MTRAFTSLTFKKKSNGADGPFHNKSNFMVYQDRLETNLFQLFAHPENSEWFSIVLHCLLQKLGAKP